MKRQRVDLATMGFWNCRGAVFKKHVYVEFLIIIEFGIMFAKKYAPIDPGLLGRPRLWKPWGERFSNPGINAYQMRLSGIKANQPAKHKATSASTHILLVLF